MHTGKANPRRRGGRDRLWRRVRALGEPCWICGLPIPLDAPARDPLSFELDELLPVSKGGSPTDPGNVAGRTVAATYGAVSGASPTSSASVPWFEPGMVRGRRRWI